MVNGATPAHDAALTTASAEMKWLNGVSLAGTFKGEFSDVTRSYAGKGIPLSVVTQRRPGMVDVGLALPHLSS